MFTIVIDPCLPPLTYRRPRLRAYFAIPDTSRREAKNRRRNHRSLAIGDVRICKPLTCYPFTFLDNRQAPHRVYPFSRRNPTLTPPRIIIGAPTFVSELVETIGRRSRPRGSEKVGRGDPDPRQIERFLEPRWKVDRRKWASLWKDRSENHAIRHRSRIPIPETPCVMHSRCPSFSINCISFQKQAMLYCVSKATNFTIKDKLQSCQYK